MPSDLKIVICGLSITSSWGNGHATTYRALVRELVRRGHEVLFLERDVPWYAENRDMPQPPFGTTRLYGSLAELRDRYTRQIQDADFVMVGSYVPEGIAVGRWAIENSTGVIAFYDIDTPVTLARLAQHRCEYLNAELIPRYDLYLSFTGGPILRHIEQYYYAQEARPLYCGVDPEVYQPVQVQPGWDLGYLGTYSADRQPALNELLIEPARCWPAGHFSVAGPQYPVGMNWPSNVHRVEHLSPQEHPTYYSAQRFTLNVTRADMVRAGYCPSVRLFEAAACGVPIVSDSWPGLDGFFKIGSEILTAGSHRQMLQILQELPEPQRQEIGQRARQRVLREHTAAHRAAELERYIRQQLEGHGSSRARITLAMRLQKVRHDSPNGEAVEVTGAANGAWKSAALTQVDQMRAEATTARTKTTLPPKKGASRECGNGNGTSESA